MSDEAPKKLCFVIGPIGKPTSEKRRHADWLLKGIIKPVFTEHFQQYHVVRADEIMQQGNISSQVINRLFDAELVIADMSLENANAFYELAIRHMKKLPTIHMIKAGEEIPFDVFPYRAISFGYEDPSHLDAAKAELKLVVEETTASGFIVENPITHARGRIELEQDASPKEKVLLEQLEAMSSRLEKLERREPLIKRRSTRSLFGDIEKSGHVATYTAIPVDPDIMANWTTDIFNKVLNDRLGTFASPATERESNYIFDIIENSASVERLTSLAADPAFPFSISRIDRSI